MPKQRKGSPRYRTINSHVWGDEKFRELSKPKANAQTLWQWLITGPRTSNIPGLVRCGSLKSIAGDLEWSVEGTAKCIEEISSRGMATFDLKAGVAWLPNGFRHSPVNFSPNVVRGYANTLLDEFPECGLVRAAVGAIRQAITAKNQNLLCDFEAILSDRLGDRSWNGFRSHPRSHPSTQSTVNSQQITDNDQEREKRAPTDATQASAPTAPASPRSAGPPSPKRRSRKVAKPEVDDETTQRARDVIALWNDTTSETRLPAQADFGELPKRDTDLVARLRGMPHRTREWWRLVFLDIAADPKSFETHGWRPMLHVIIQSEEKLRERFEQAKANRKNVSAPAQPRRKSQEELLFDNAVEELRRENEVDIPPDTPSEAWPVVLPSNALVRGGS